MEAELQDQGVASLRRGFSGDIPGEADQGPRQQGSADAASPRSLSSAIDICCTLELLESYVSGREPGLVPLPKEILSYLPRKQTQCPNEVYTLHERALENQVAPRGKVKADVDPKNKIKWPLLRPGKVCPGAAASSDTLGLFHMFINRLARGQGGWWWDFFFTLAFHLLAGQHGGRCWQQSWDCWRVLCGHFSASSRT